VPPSDHVRAFALVALVFVAIPGPSVLFTVSRALTLGRRPALLAVLGNAAGVYLHIVAVAFGVGAIIQRSVTSFTALKMVGALYLVYLGAQAIRHRRSLADLVGNRSQLRWTSRAVLPQFVQPGAAPATTQLLVLGLVAIGVVLLSDSMWAMVAGAAREWFVNSPRRLATINCVGGFAMIGLGLRLALTGCKD
jgi:threonine/homoserine/homoserine lactone efflux protein